MNIVEGHNNRALQMNEGAKQAKGDAFLFLHVDCLLDAEGIKAIHAALENGYVGGCLRQRIQSRKAIFRWIETSGNLRAEMFKIFYGDQAIFARRDIFFQIGGFDNPGFCNSKIRSYGRPMKIPRSRAAQAGFSFLAACSDSV